MREKIFGPLKQYKIRDDGKFFRRINGNGKKITNTWVEVIPKIGVTDYTGAGYLSIGLTLEKNKARNFRIHRLVAENFVKGYKKGYCVNHKDGNRLNNHHSNLEWVSHKKNMQNMAFRGSRKGKCLMGGKLDNEKVLTVITLLNVGIRNSRISEHFKINQSCVSTIKSGKTHKNFTYLLNLKRT